MIANLTDGQKDMYASDLIRQHEIANGKTQAPMPGMYDREPTEEEARAMIARYGSLG